MAETDGLLLIISDGVHHAGNLVGQLKEYIGYAVLVAVEQIARIHCQATDDNGDPYLHQVYVGVGDGNLLGEELEAQLPHFIQVSHGSISGDANRAQGLDEGRELGFQFFAKG